MFFGTFSLMLSNLDERVKYDIGEVKSLAMALNSVIYVFQNQEWRHARRAIKEPKNQSLQ
jgi:hypothetical protein